MQGAKTSRVPYGTWDDSPDWENTKAPFGGAYFFFDNQAEGENVW